jgi:ribulose-phosphate 3-epimerase
VFLGNHMPIICPTITAYDPHEYRAQMERVAPFASRVHIDLMDGEFAPTKSPPLEKIWWPLELEADIHLMYQRPMECLDQLIALKPRMVIIHNEAEVHHMRFAAELHKADIMTGLAILHDTPIEYAFQIMHSFDQVLIFSGKLGYHGGEADLGLLDKVAKVRVHHVDAEIAWDGGINENNIKDLTNGGVNILNVGGYIQKNDDPRKAYATLEALVQNR